MTIKTNGLLACPECDGLQREPAVPVGGLARCHRCGACLFRNRPRSLDRTLAWLVTAAFAFVFANVFPLMELDAQGLRTSATLFETAQRLHVHGMTSVAVLVFATTILFPAIELAMLLYILVPLRIGFVPEGLRFAFRAMQAVRNWGMVEVYILGALVSLVKLTQIAQVQPGWGIYAVGAYIVLLAAAESSFETREMWRRVEALGGQAAPAAAEART
jgi:paraquat-inducible protein A